jgi:hypothetical protein
MAQDLHGARKGESKYRAVERPVPNFKGNLVYRYQFEPHYSHHDDHSLLSVNIVGNIPPPPLPIPNPQAALESGKFISAGAMGAMDLNLQCIHPKFRIIVAKAASFD